MGLVAVAYVVESKKENEGQPELVAIWVEDSEAGYGLRRAQLEE